MAHTFVPRLILERSYRFDGHHTQKHIAQPLPGVDEGKATTPANKQFRVNAQRERSIVDILLFLPQSPRS